jgi:probable DNA repair protein
MPITIDFEDITPFSNNNSLILTPNSRTQMALVGGYMQSKAVGDVVRAPNIISISQWLEQLWQSLSFNHSMPIIVADLELKTWLKELIVADPNWQLTNALGVAEKILEAYRNLTLWDKSLADLVNLETPENHYFVKWTQLLEAFLETNNLVPRFSIIKKLLSYSIVDYLPNQLVLVGFNQLNPLEESLLEFCKKQGTKIALIKPRKIEANISRIEALDLQQELEIAAIKAKELTLNSSDISVGVVVQQLSSCLPLIHQVFSECFQPQELLPWQALEKNLYNISAGQPLAELSMINSAIQLLQLQSRGLDLQALAFLKNSPFIFWGENEGSIKRFIHAQSLLAFNHYSLSYLLSAAEKEPKPELLELFITRINELKNREQYARPMLAWTNSWKSILSIWGWLDDYALQPKTQNSNAMDVNVSDNFDNKVKAEFLLALKESLTINHIYKKLSHAQAKDYLSQVLRQKVFQTPSDRTNIQILGVLEAAGLEFDQLIMVGFNRDNWPQKHKVNPFIPIAFQQENNMPGSSASREYEYAKDLSDSLLSSANEILITHSSNNDDELSSESALFSEFPLSTIHLDALLQCAETIKPDYEWVKDEKIDLSSAEIKGGAYLLSQYATCPFRAMSSFQLKIQSAEFPHKGIEPRIRGAWLHLVMELIWTKLKSQSALLELSENALLALVKESIDKAKLEFDAQLSATTSSEIVEIEIDKMISQIMQWLELDKQREPFEVATEIDKELVLGALKFKFRVDRIDTNSRGEIEIIDYKTGNVDVKKWLGKRPEEAQMPAYVLACQNETIGSLSYAKIKTGEVLSSGVWFDDKAKNGFRFIDRNLEGKKDRTKYILSNNQLIDLEQDLAQQWHANLVGIANKIVDGDMQVSPKNEIESCRYCEFEDFCRVGETQPIEMREANE